MFVQTCGNLLSSLTIEISLSKTGCHEAVNLLCIHVLWTHDRFDGIYSCFVLFLSCMRPFSAALLTFVWLKQQYTDLSCCKCFCD